MTDTAHLKKVALHEIHTAMGAKIVPFAGFMMPLQYSNLIQEHMAVRQQAGMFDVSHMGEFIISGPHALALLQWVTSNDVSKLTPGKVQYSCLPNDTGGIVDDLLVYQLDTDQYLLVVNASNIDKDWNWIKSQNTMGADMKNVSDDYSLLAVQGPLATTLLQSLTNVTLSEIPYYHFNIGSMAGIDDVILSNTGYTGAGGFELYVKNEHASTLWNMLLEKGQTIGLLPCGLGCRDTLRMEKGFCLYGNDIHDDTSPIEAGLGWITRFNHPFVHSDYHLQLKEKGVKQKLVGFEMIDRGIPRNGYDIKTADGTLIGKVTSGTQSPSLQKAIGMGYVAAGFHTAGTDIYIDIRQKLIKATVTSLPFL
jgi:aminomethyltransferase